MALLVAILLALFVLDGPWDLVAVVSAFVLEVGEAAAWFWWSKRRRPAVGVEAMLGEVATVLTPLAPIGQVRIKGEFWRARSEDGARPGDQVEVVAVDPDGLTLAVERRQHS